VVDVFGHFISLLPRLAATIRNATNVGRAELRLLPRREVSAPGDLLEPIKPDVGRGDPLDESIDDEHQRRTANINGEYRRHLRPTPS
jgi:hypothetical protein